MSLSQDEEEEPQEIIMGLDLSTWEDRSYEQREKSLQEVVKEAGGEDAATKESPSKTQTEAATSVPAPSVTVRERARTADEPSQRTTRAKRESRRMRELEQAQFSLELLKVRANSGGAASPCEDRRWSLELVPPASPPLLSPQGTPDSQSSKGSFELLMMDEEPPKAREEVTDIEDPFSPLPPVSPVSDPKVDVVSTSPKPAEPYRTELSDTVAHQGSPIKTDPAHVDPPKVDYLPTFYVPAGEGSSHSAAESQQSKDAAVSTATSVINRRESTRRPVVVVISMQKEIPLSEELSNAVRPSVEVRDSTAQTGDLTPASKKPDRPAVPAPTSVPQADQAVIEKLVRLNEEKKERQRNQQQQNEKEMMEQIRRQKEVLEKQRLYFAQYERDMFEKQKDEALLKIEQSRQSGQDVSGTAASRKPLRPISVLVQRAAGEVPHTRTLSDSTVPQPQQPPPPASPPTKIHMENKPVPEGWAPKLTLESRDRGGIKERATAKKPPSNQGTAVGMRDKPGSIFFSPNDKVTFAK